MHQQDGITETDKMKRGTRMISDEYIIDLDEIVKKFKIPFHNFVDMYCENRTLYLVDERHESVKEKKK